MLAPLALTQGEPAGIGVEIAALAWIARKHASLSPFILIADPAFVSQRLEAAKVSVPATVVADPAAAIDQFGATLPIFDPVSPVARGIAGSPSAEDAASVISAIETGVELVHEGRCSAVVTAPIQKESLYQSGFEFPGHTEFLGALANRRGAPATPVMMLACDELRVVPVTVHQPLRSVADDLTTARIVEVGSIVARELASRFGIAGPRLALAGLNPHAGEGGTLGAEDAGIIAPAVEQLRAMGIDATGPLPADTMFHAEARARYDAALCMYHDQALIPIKTLAFDQAVNVTLGLPFVRTSPDHGTALDIAGTGKANPASLIEALRLAKTLSDKG